MKYSAYPVYKDSGVEWLGEIPEHWKAIRLRRRCQLQQGLQIAQNERFSEPGDNRFEYITIKSINAGSTHVNNKEYIEKPPSSVICTPDDILLARTGATGEVISGQFGVFHNNFFKVNYNHKKILKDYLIYYLKSSQIKEHLLLLAGTTTIPDLNHGEFLDTPFFEPSIDEQKAIASFLDRETAKIDALIAKKERLIELLQEKRTAIVSHAVTKGLDSTVQMKDSGVEWLGEIPEHWEAKRLRFTIRNGTQNGLYKSKDYYDDKGTPIISMSEAFASSVTHVLAKDRVQLTDDEYRSYSLEKGDLLFARRSLVFEGSGKCSMVGELPEVHIFESSIIRVRPDISVVEPLFALLSLNSVPGRFQILRITKQVTISGIDAPNLKDVVIPLPPRDEQVAIISFINRETTKIDTLIAKIREGIEKLKEYRTALISAAVTGKIDVRNEVAA